MKLVIAGAISAALVSIGAVAYAQGAPAGQPQPQAAASKPNASDPIICEKEEQIGSRLSTRKVCHTRSEWAQLRLNDRNVTERVQSERGMDLNGH